MRSGGMRSGGMRSGGMNKYPDLPIEYWYEAVEKRWEAWQARAALSVTSPAAVPREGGLYLPPDMLNLLDNVLRYYGDEFTYQPERVGGVLQGCPRGEPPISKDNGFGARQFWKKLKALYDAADAQFNPWAAMRAAELLEDASPPAAVPRDAELKLMWNEAIETAACKVENMMSKPIANSVNHIAETVRGLKTVWADLPAAPPAAVPREPTEAMVQAGADTPQMKRIDGALALEQIRSGTTNSRKLGDTWNTCAIAECWRAMYDAAPPAAESRSVLRRVAIQKGDPQPEFDPHGDK